MPRCRQLKPKGLQRNPRQVKLTNYVTHPLNPPPVRGTYVSVGVLSLLQQYGSFPCHSVKLDCVAIKGTKIGNELFVPYLMSLIFLLLCDVIVEVSSCPSEAQLLSDVVGIWAIYHPEEGFNAVALELINPLWVV